MTPLVLPAALVLATLQGALGAAFGAWTPALYSLFALAVLLEVPRPSRLYAAFGLGLLADVFAAGRTGGTALAFVLAAAAVSRADRSFGGGRPSAARFSLAFVFLLVSTAAYTLFADSSVTVSSAFSLLAGDVVRSLANACLAVFLLPPVSSFLSAGRKSVTLSPPPRL